MRYLGWFSGNPTQLNPLPPTSAGTRYVAALGGPERVLTLAGEAFAEADYQWVCELLQHLVNVEPEHVQARALLADALEQLGYQAESGPWRNFYLCGARELREGVPAGSQVQISRGVARGMPLEDFYKALAVRLNPERAEGLHVRVNLHFEDLNTQHLLTIERSVMHAWPGRSSSEADADVHLTSQEFKEFMLGGFDPRTQTMQDRFDVKGDATVLQRLPELFDGFVRRFPIMTPRA